MNSEFQILGLQCSSFWYPAICRGQTQIENLRFHCLRAFGCCCGCCMVLVSAVVVMMVSGDDDVVVDDDGGWRVAVAVGGMRWGWMMWIGEM